MLWQPLAAARATPRQHRALRTGTIPVIRRETLQDDDAKESAYPKIELHGDLLSFVI